MVVTIDNVLHADCIRGAADGSGEGRGGEGRKLYSTGLGMCGFEMVLRAKMV